MELENQRLAELQESRKKNKAEQAKKTAVSKKFIASLPQKLGEHWLILGTALFFDVLGAIPFIGVIFNGIFAMILWMYFGPKRKPGESEIEKLVLPAVITSIIDFFTAIFPANLATATIRIALS